MSATLGALVIAIATEFSVLLAARYEEERRASVSVGEALRRAYSRTGAAVLASGITAIAGFAALIATDIRMLRDFGLVTVLDLAVALLGVLVVLPAALVWAESTFARRSASPPRPPSRRQRRTETAPAGESGADQGSERWSHAGALLDLGRDRVPGPDRDRDLQHAAQQRGRAARRRRGRGGGADAGVRGARARATARTPTRTSSRTTARPRANPCPADEQRTAACEVELPNVIRVCDCSTARWCSRSGSRPRPSARRPRTRSTRAAARYRGRVNFLSIAVRGDREELRRDRRAARLDGCRSAGIATARSPTSTGSASARRSRSCSPAGSCARRGSAATSSTTGGSTRRSTACSPRRDGARRRSR